MPDFHEASGVGEGLMGSLDGAVALETGGDSRSPVIDVDRDRTGNDDESDDKPAGDQRHIAYLLQPIAHVCPVGEVALRQRSRATDT